MVTLFVTAHLLIGVASGFLFDRPGKTGAARSVCQCRDQNHDLVSDFKDLKDWLALFGLQRSATLHKGVPVPVTTD